MSKPTDKDIGRWMRPQEIAAECIFVIPAKEVKGFTVAMAPLGTLSWSDPCVVMEEDPYSDEGPVIVVDRWRRPLTGATIDEMAINARKLGLMVSRRLFLPPDVDEARLDALGLNLRPG